MYRGDYIFTQISKMSPLVFIANILEATTQKKMAYKDCFWGSADEAWFSNVTYDGENYRTVIFSDDGVFRMYKKHPLDQKGTSKQIKLMPCEQGQ